MDVIGRLKVYKRTNSISNATNSRYAHCDSHNQDLIGLLIVCGSEVIYIDFETEPRIGPMLDPKPWATGASSTDHQFRVIAAAAMINSNGLEKLQKQSR